jgi:hypothetical protein
MNRIQELLELYMLEQPELSYTECNGIYTARFNGASYEIHGLSHLTCLFRGLYG